MLEISSKARKALDAICDTFVPGEAGLPSATELGVPEAMLMAVGSRPSATEQEQFAGLLDSWDTSPFAVALRRPKREALLLALGRLARRRAAGRRSRRCARASC